MLKKIIPLAIILILVGVMVVQAVEKDKEVQNVKKGKTMSADDSNQALDKLYNDIMSSQIEEPEQDPEEGLDIGLKAPMFELQTLEGKTMKLSDLKGKKTLLNFFATWCTPCKTEMPLLEKFSVKHKNDLNIIAINIDPRANVKKYVKKLGLTFPILIDEKGKVNENYQVIAIPTTFLLNEKGIIINKHIGELNGDQLKNMLKP
ncbi:TlpA family protein disulfide reductase [Heyndrickxia vini]|uniref:TlpA family protein disulfide reductase n=1 Tax=Heyndrickxia vini TaxID=1476025 RepID=A0ABX7E6B2_9BACI|nr:TlpA disulfide reductase family protein [Heyndrickxia vini]QQZ11258.1 TlpA family protein disulfide reductase [Heyndrickxia vini]